jgi:hypothetical protein
MEGHINQLAALADKAGVTGQMDLDGYFNALKARGFGDDVANSYRVQYAETMAEIGKLLSGGMGNAALTEGVRGEAHRLLPEGAVVPAHTLRAIAKTMTQNANIRYKAYTDQVTDYDRRYQDYKRTGVMTYPQQELEETPAPATSAPGKPTTGTPTWE